MYIYFNESLEPTTIIPHGEILRQGGDLNLYLCFDKEIKDSSISCSIIKDGIEHTPTCFKNQGHKAFFKLKDSEIIYDLIDKKKYYTYYAKFLPEVATSDFGNITLYFTMYDINDNISKTSVNLYVEKTFGYAKPKNNITLSQYQQLLNEISKIDAKKVDMVVLDEQVVFADSIDEKEFTETDLNRVFIDKTNGNVYRIIYNNDKYEPFIINYGGQSGGGSGGGSGIVEPDNVIFEDGETLTQKISKLDEIDVQTTAEKVYFDDGETLAEKYINGELGGGGGSDDEIILTYITDNNISVAVGNDVNIEYKFIREINKTRKGTEKVYLDSSLISSKSISQGNNSVKLQNLKRGTHTIEIEISSSGLTSSLVYSVEVIELTISSTIDPIVVNNGDTFTYRYTPVGSIEKIIYFYLDDEPYGARTVDESGKVITYELTGLTHGAHSLQVYSTAILNGATIKSNVLEHVLVVNNGGTETIIGCNFKTTTAKQGDLLVFNYIAYTPNSIDSNINLLINGTSIKSLTVGRTLQTWSLRDYPTGEVTFSIQSGETIVSYTVQVTEAEINVEPITHNLELYLTSNGRSNQESEETRNVWENNGISATFTDFNWVSNGWVLDNDENSVLRINGNAKVTIPIKLFETDFRSVGKTIEFECSTYDVRDYDSVLINCMSNDRGFSLTSNLAILSSEQTTVETKFKEDEKVRISFVIEPTSENRLIYTYINGIISGLKVYSSNDNFSQSNPIGITIGSPDATIDIYNIRVYNINLDHSDILTNYIADTPDVGTKTFLYNSNNIFDSYGSINYQKVLQQLPCLTFIGELPGFKGDKKTVSINYANMQDSGKNFIADSVILDVQGTSSQYYPRKNYKFKLTESYKLTDNSIEEKEFCLKADYMESSHSHNTGIAKIVNKLYPTTPPKEDNSQVQAAITGFPIVVWHKENESDEPFCLGVYNFNNEKANTTTFGYTEDYPLCESWEFRNNTSEHCKFESDNFEDTEEVAKNFEARYPDKYSNYDALSRVVSWVYSTRNDLNKFKSEFSQYFNLDATLLYYCLTELFAMVDSRAKNLFLTTWDGLIWYPTFYDMDTAFGLNNEGVNDFSYSVEYHDIKGSQNVFNGESSVLWNNFEQMFAEEISEFYFDLRNNDKVTYDTVMDVLYGEQISKICESNYNYDAVEKYKNPLVEDGEDEYIYVAQGSRLEHLKWWLYNRLRYMDSKYVAGDFGKDFLSLRIYTPESYGSVIPNANAYITPYIDQYIVVKYDENSFSARGVHNEETVITAPDQTFNDTPMVVYGASHISKIGDLSPLYPGTVDVSSAIKLKELIIGNSSDDYSNTNLIALSVGNNKLLTKLDVRNCPNLVQTINVSGCTSIEEIYATGTSTTSVDVPNGGNLKKLHLPGTITNLTILNHPFLTEFVCEGYDNLNTLRLENTAVNSLNIVQEAKDTLERIRLINIDWQLDSVDLLEELMTCKGLDENDQNQEKSVLTGKVHINGTISTEQLEDFEGYWGASLVVTADHVVVSYECSFYNYDGTLLYTVDIPEGSYATYSGETPTKPNDDTYSYEFSGWSPALDSTPIITNTSFTAQFVATKLLVVQWLNYDSSVLQRNAVKNGESVTYTGTTPTRPNDVQYKNYTFSSWLDSNGNTYDKGTIIVVSSDLTLTAQYTGILQTYNVHWYNGDTLLQTTVGQYGTTAEYSGSTPTNEDGYTFIGWGTIPNSSVANADLTITGEMTFYAAFDKPDILEIEVVDSIAPSYTLASCTGVDEEVTIDWGDGDVTTYTVTTSGTECVKPNAYAIGEYSIKLPATENFKITGSSVITSNQFTAKYIFYKTVTFKYWKCAVRYFFAYQTKLTSVNLGTTSTKIYPNMFIAPIENYFFKGCSNLVEIIIPEGITRLQIDVFTSCSKLEKVHFPSTMSSVNSGNGFGSSTQGMFGGCYSLHTITVAEDNTYYDSRENCNAIIRKADNCLVYGCGNTIIPSSVTAIDKIAFQYMTNLESIEIPSNVTSIGRYAFSGCTKLTHVRMLPQTPPTLAEGAFYAYYSGTCILKEIWVPTFEAWQAYTTATNWSAYANIITTDDRGLVEISNQILGLNVMTSKNITLGYFGDNPTFSAVSSNTGICNTSVSGDVLTITAVGAGTANITVVMTISDETYTQTFSVEVFETIPEYTYSVEAIDGVTYGFTLNDSGYYESTNQAIHNSFSLCKLTFTANGLQNLYLDCISSGENTCDFGILSNVDTTLTASYADDSSSAFKSFKGLASTSVQTVDYGIIEAGEHFIYIKYRKDSSSNSGNDSLQFQVRIE